MRYKEVSCDELSLRWSTSKWSSAIDLTELYDSWDRHHVPQLCGTSLMLDGFDWRGRATMLVVITQVYNCTNEAALPIYHIGRNIHIFDARRRSIYALVSINQKMIYYPSAVQRSKAFHSIHPLLREMFYEIFFFMLACLGLTLVVIGPFRALFETLLKLWRSWSSSYHICFPHRGIKPISPAVWPVSTNLCLYLSVPVAPFYSWTCKAAIHTGLSQVTSSMICRKT